MTIGTTSDGSNTLPIFSVLLIRLIAFRHRHPETVRHPCQIFLNLDRHTTYDNRSNEYGIWPASKKAGHISRPSTKDGHVCQSTGASDVGRYGHDILLFDRHHIASALVPIRGCGSDRRHPGRCNTCLREQYRFRIGMVGKEHTDTLFRHGHMGLRRRYGIPLLRHYQDPVRDKHIIGKPHLRGRCVPHIRHRRGLGREYKVDRLRMVQIRPSRGVLRIRG